MACPHCATPAPGGSVCRVCGVDAAGHDEQVSLPGLEVNRHPPVNNTQATPISGLEPSRRNVAAESESDLRCHRCRALAGSGHFCQRCGTAVREGFMGEERPPLRCLQCGVPNPADRDICLSCGVDL